MAGFAADLIRIDTTNRGGGDGRERPAAEYVAARLAEAGVEPVLLESAPGRANVVARVAGREPGAAALLRARAPGRGARGPGVLDRAPVRGRDPRRRAVGPRRGGHEERRRGAARGGQPVGADGVRPRRDVVLAFTADEEDTAEFGAQWLVERHPELFEGCTEAVGNRGPSPSTPGPGQRLYPIASAERGTAWLRLTARGRAGHGAKPNPENAVTRLSAAMARIGGYRWPVRLIPTVRSAVSALAAAAGRPAACGLLGRPGRR